MRTIEKKVYSFNELSVSAQENALSNLYNINLYEWWEFTYEDAKNVGLEIKEFDIDHQECYGVLEDSMNNSIDLIMSNHDAESPTYALAFSYRMKWDELVAKYSDGVNTSEVHEDNIDQFDQDADELGKDFRSDLCAEYLSILKKEYEYQTSREAIVETIEANEYEFTEDGKLI